MNQKVIYVGIGIIILLLLIFTIPKYFAGNVIASEVQISGDLEKIEVIHFHGANQCLSCITLGDFAEETINSYFKDELKSGKITFSHLNGQLPENREIVLKYGAKGSSLHIGTYNKNGDFFYEENINVWYKLGNKQDYMDYLKDVIEQKFKGE